MVPKTGSLCVAACMCTLVTGRETICETLNKVTSCGFPTAGLSRTGEQDNPSAFACDFDMQLTTLLSY